MIALDTNVISELARAEPERHVVRWVDSRREPLAITAVTVGELLHVVPRPPAGRRRAALATAVDALVDDVFAGHD